MEKLVRRPNAVILFISLSLLMMLTTGCQEIKLKAGIEAANKQCPIDMGETGKITSIVYDGENVVYTFYLNEEAANIKTLQKNPESMKTSLKIMFQNPNKEVKSLLDLVVKCKAGLQMIYIGKDSGEQVVCELTTDEIKEILNKDVDTTESDLAKLETQVQMANLQFPIQASEDVLIEKIELSDEAVIYICRVDEDLCDMNQIKANAAEVKQGIIETLGNQTDLATQLFIKSCVNCDRNIVYRYIGTQSFDMDGVLFNSMPYHSEAWHQVMKTHGLDLSREEAYMHEGRTGASTINIVFQRELGKEATQEEIESIYHEKSILFNSYPEAERMPGAWELLQKVKSEGLTPMVVTGSGQLSLLERLEHNFPGMFHKELMVTAFDVKYGKPNPEPYLMALRKGGFKADEAIVIENAPLGVEAGHKAGIFTIAVNTGPLDGQVLLDAGADLLFPSMQALCDSWDTIML